MFTCCCKKKATKIDPQQQDEQEAVVGEKQVIIKESNEAELNDISGQNSMPCESNSYKNSQIQQLAVNLEELGNNRSRMISVIVQGSNPNDA